MPTLKKSGIILLIFLSACSFTKKNATYIPAGTSVISEEPQTGLYSVPDKDGNLQPHVTLTLPVGTISKYDPNYKIAKDGAK
jgi:hypothetical protein